MIKKFSFFTLKVSLLYSDCIFVSHYLSLFVNHSSLRVELICDLTLQFKSYFHNRCSTAKLRPPNKHQQKKLTEKHQIVGFLSVSLVHKSTSRSLVSTSRNTNIVFPCKICSNNINHKDEATHCDIYVSVLGTSGV